MTKNSRKNKSKMDRQELFEALPVSKALMTLAGPAIISQLINLIYNMVDAFFIGRTGNSYMIAATTLSLTIFLLTVAIANLFGIGGGSLMTRLAGKHRIEEAKTVSAFSIYGAIVAALSYSALIGCLLRPILTLFGASDNTIGYASSYTILVIVIGSLPMILSQTAAHLLRNAGYSGKASIGLSGGGILNILLDPLFMFVLLPPGQEVTGAAIATLLSNCVSCVYLVYTCHKVSGEAPVSLSLRDARGISRRNCRELFTVGIPSCVLVGLLDVGNIFLNMIAATQGDLVLAGLGIVMKIERIPNALSIGLCQGMIPLVAYNFSSGNHERMEETIRTARRTGLLVAAACIVIFEVLASPATKVFLNTGRGNAEEIAMTLGYAVLLLRIRCLASPVQFLNFSSSYCMQAMGYGSGTLIHAVARQFAFYIPFLYLFVGLWGVKGLGIALIAGEGCGGLFAMWLLRRFLQRRTAAEQE